MALLKDSNCYIAILWISNIFCVIEASNDTKLVSMMEIQASANSSNAVVETKNKGMECWSHCKNQQGPCPSWCGKHGMCCTMNPYWKDKSNGCDGTFGGAWRHECVYNEVILCMNDKKSPCTFRNETVCETNYILINSSSEDGHNNTSIHEIWCPYVSSSCYQFWDNTFSFWLDGVMRSTVALIGIILNIVFCYVLSQKQLRNVFNSLLIALAVFDTFFLVFDILEALRRESLLVSEVHIFLFPKFLYPFQRIMFCSSIFMTVSISLERYIAVTDPIRLHLEVRNDKDAQVKRFLKYLVPVFVFSIIANIPKFFEATANYDEATKILQIGVTSLRRNPDYIFYYSGITRLTVTLIVPFVVVIYLNAKTYKQIYIRRNQQKAASAKTEDGEMDMMETNDRENGKPLILRAHIALQKEKHTSEEKLFFIFSSISLLFLVCHLPRFILDIDEAIFQKESIECTEAGYSVAPLWALQLGDISNLFLTINSSLNSAIYCLLSRKYRSQAKKALTCIKDRET